MSTTALSPEARAALIQRLIDHVTSEVDSIDTESRYDQLLDEIYREALTGPFEHLSPSGVMREMCPTDYRVGHADYTGTQEDWTEIGGNYYEGREIEKAREGFIDDLRSDLTDAEKALYNAENDPGVSTDWIASLRDDVARLEAEIDAVEGYAF